MSGPSPSYPDSRSAGGPVRKNRSASDVPVLALTPLGEVLETGQIKVDPLLDPIRPLAGLFEGLTVVAELHSNLGPVLLSWLKIRSASLRLPQLLGQLGRRDVLRLATHLQPHAGAALLGPLRPLFAGLLGGNPDLYGAFSDAHRCRHSLYLLWCPRAC